MTGLASVQAQIAAIEARFAPPAAVAVPAARSGPGGFDAVLRTTMAATGPSSAAATSRAERLAPGQYGRLDPPVDLLPFGNGRVPIDALTPIGQGDHRLWGPAATAFGRLRAAARADGVELGVTSSYRDLPTQVRLAAEKGLYMQGGLSALPGTSPHGWGLSVDLDLDAPAQHWMRTNAWRFGFVEDVPREPWHWTFRPAS